MNVVRYNSLLSLWRPGSIVSGKEVVSSFSPADSYLIDVPIAVLYDFRLKMILSYQEFDLHFFFSLCFFSLLV